MGRWKPDAAGRLQRAAMELYRERGFDQTTVAEIAERAGLAERTFFRYFTDKREVLFAGSHTLVELLVSALTATPRTDPPIEQVITALHAADEFFTDRDYSRQRQEVINAHPELHERELIKLHSLATAFADVLRERGVDDPTASMCGEIGVSVFRIAFERWADGDEQQSFADSVDEAVANLREITLQRDPGPPAHLTR